MGSLAWARSVRLRSLLCTLTVAAAGLTGLGCEKQSEPQRLHGQVHLTLIHTADIHSRLYPYNLQLGQVDAGLGLGEALSITNVGGAARISHIVGRERARASRVLHLDGGDCFQGAPVFNFYNGEAEMRTMAAMGTDSMTVANHEFDRGAQNLATQIKNWATFPVLAANYKYEKRTTPVITSLVACVHTFTYIVSYYHMVDCIRMGNLSSLTSIFNQPNSFGITPLNTTETTQFYVDLLRPLVDVVIVVSHLGLDVDEQMITTTEGIDV